MEMSVVLGGLQYFNAFLEIYMFSMFHVAPYSLSKQVFESSNYGLRKVWFTIF